MRKTISRWIDDAISLSPEQKQKAKAYAIKHVMPNGYQPNPLNFEATSLSDALLGSFVFSETEEGHNYWWNLIFKEERVSEELYDYSAE